jgi:hypothetical protein
VRPAANTLQPPTPGAVARLLRSLRGLPEAVRAPGPGSTGLAGWFKAETPPPTDITARFREVHQRVREGEPVLPDEARRHQYLLVKGMMGDKVLGYLEDNQARLEKRGLETLEVAVDTEDVTFPTLFQGDAASVEDLSYARRMEFVRQHPYPADIPTVSLATSRLSRRSLMRPLCAYVQERYGWACDGLVNAVDAEVPGSRVVRLDGLPGFSNYFPSDLTETMVTLALDAPAR